MIVDIHREFLDDSTTLVYGKGRAGRVWRVRPDAVLTGVTFPQPWTSGVNEAVCVWSDCADEDAVQLPAEWHRPGSPMRVAGIRTDRHLPGSARCTCGFWSYHSGDMLAWATGWDSDDHRVGGVVEVHGRMTRASRGWRTRYARIVALVAPVWAAPPRPVPPSGGPAFAYSWLAYLNSAANHERRSREGAALWARVQERYADVPTYPNLAAALEAHPLT